VGRERTRREDLEERLDVEQARSMDLTERILALREEQARLQTEIAGGDTRLAELRKQLEDRKKSEAEDRKTGKELQQLEQAAAKARGQMDALRTQEKEFAAQAGKLEAEVGKSRARVQALEKQSAELGAREKALQDSVDALKSKLAALEKEKDDLEKGAGGAGAADETPAGEGDGGKSPAPPPADPAGK